MLIITIFLLTQLPEPLLTFDLYNDFIGVGKEIQHLSEREAAAETPGIVNDLTYNLRDLLERLPPYRYYTLQHMMRHLHRYYTTTQCTI